MKNKDRAKNLALISVSQSLLGNPPYRGDLHQYIRERQEEEEEESSQNKLSSILEDTINHLEKLLKE